MITRILFCLNVLIKKECLYIDVNEPLQKLLYGMKAIFFNL